MPHRVDKKDTLALMALVSDLDIDFIDGVNGSLIHPSALPPVRIYILKQETSLTVSSTGKGEEQPVPLDAGVLT